MHPRTFPLTFLNLDYIAEDNQWPIHAFLTKETEFWRSWYCSADAEGCRERMRGFCKSVIDCIQGSMNGSEKEGIVRILGNATFMDIGYSAG